MRNDYPEIIGCKVYGIIDRPIGSCHPHDKEMIYPINYGYVKNVFAEDGEEQDIYLLGVDVPVNMFEGCVIAVYRRSDDIEDKWIVSADGKDYPDEVILEKIAFQEQFFHGKLLR